MVTCSVYLFGKPAWELRGESLTAEDVEELGKSLATRMQEVANTFRILCTHKWEYVMALYDILFSKNISVAKAKKELAALGIADAVLFEDE